MTEKTTVAKWFRFPENVARIPNFYKDLPEEAVLDLKELLFVPVVKRPVQVEAALSPCHVLIPTLEGEMLANPGDYIIRGVQGEYYPCKPEIFLETYACVEDSDHPIAPPNGLELIARERNRQIAVEKYDADHDAQHVERELVEAAIAYAAAPGKVYARRDMDDPQVFLFEEIWPWAEDFDKRDKHDEIRRLAIAGALIAAEIDRLQAASKEVAP